MKAGTQNHLKTKRLMRVAGIPLYRAVGILETLWLLCQDCCDEGNIGKFTDDEIADYLGWDGKPSELVRHLTDSGWVDADHQHRLVVHDWLDECPEFIRDRVRKRRARASLRCKQTTCEESDTDTLGQHQTCPALSDSVPSIPNQSNPNQSNPSHPQTPGENGLAGGWDDLDSVAKARLSLRSVNYSRYEDLIVEMRAAGSNPAEIVAACNVYRANASKFKGPGAIAEFLRTGVWPADGVVSPEKAVNGRHKRDKQANDARARKIITEGRKAGQSDEAISGVLKSSGLQWP